MRDVFNFINIKDVCKQRGLPYELILSIIFNKKRLERNDISVENHTARIVALVDYSKETRRVSKITYSIVLTPNENHGQIIADDKGVFYARTKYRVNVESLPYYKDLHNKISEIIKNNKCTDEYLKYAGEGLEYIWDAFYDKMNEDVIKSQEKYPKYAFILHHLELPELEGITGIKLSKYTDRVYPRNCARCYIMYIIQEKIKTLNYIINVDSDVPSAYLTDTNKALDNIPDYLDRLDINKNIVDLITNKVFLMLDDKKEVYTSTTTDGKTHVADTDDLRRWNVKLYNKLKKLLEIQYDDMVEAFQIIAN